jgi:hypothetical protein
MWLPPWRTEPGFYAAARGPHHHSAFAVLLRRNGRVPKIRETRGCAYPAPQ